MTVRVLLVDDQALVRTGFRLVLGAEEGIEVVGEAADGERAVALTRQLEPDVVVMDVRMPHVDGIEATGRILASGSRARVLLLTTFDLDEFAFGGLRAGASGFLLKDVPPAELARGIRAVAAGDAVLAPRVTRRLLETMADELALADDASEARGRVDVLTPRELDVLGEIATGATNAEIAERFVLSETTVKTHVGRIFAKLVVRDRVGAVIVAFRAGLVQP